MIKNDFYKISKFDCGTALSQKSKQNKRLLPQNGRFYVYHPFYDKVRLYFKTEKVRPVDSALKSLELSCCLQFQKSEAAKVKKIKISSFKSNN